MVKAAVDFSYGKDFYKEGSEIPDSLVPELEKHQCHVLETFIKVNGSWHRIDDPKIEGWVEMNKHQEKRLKHLVKDKEPKTMLKSDTNKLKKK